MTEASNRKKILIFSLSYFPRFVGGAEVAIKEITDRLGADFEFHLITLRYDSNLPRISREGNVTVHRIGFSVKNPSIGDLRKLPLRFLKVWFQFGAFFAARTLHKQEHFSIVWGMMAHTAGVPSALFKRYHPEVKYILNLQEGDPPEHIENQMRIFGALFRDAFTKADIVQTLSYFLERWAKKMGACRTIVIPNGITPARFGLVVPFDIRTKIRKSAGAHEDETLLVTVSRLVPKNGVDTVLEALTILPQIRFLIAGDGPDREKLEALALKLGVRDRVTFIGEVSQQDLPNLLSSCDIFIRASRSEGQGISFIEAMASRLPTIGTSVGGIPDFLIEGETGFVTIPESPKGIAAAIQRVLKDPAKTQMIVTNALALARDTYDWDRIADTMERNVLTE